MPLAPIIIAKIFGVWVESQVLFWRLRTKAHAILRQCRAPFV